MVKVSCFGSGLFARGDHGRCIHAAFGDLINNWVVKVVESFAELGTKFLDCLDAVEILRIPGLEVLVVYVVGA
jgi:hypothetical protein